MTMRSRLFSLAIATLAAGSAQASFIDSDFYCRVHGCVIVHDGFTFDVYDIFVFANGSTVPPGGRMIPWSGNPFQGSGEVKPVFTGTRTEGFHSVPLQDQGVRLGIDTNGDGVADLSPLDDGDGFLDAGDSFGPFNLSAGADLVSDSTSAQRSFYLSSRTDFFLSAQVSLRGASDALNTPGQLENIEFIYDVTRRGNDAGMAFGADARTGNFIRRIGNVSTLRDVYGAPTNILEFTNSIRRRASNSLPAQSIRFDYVYGFEGYDLSIGAGDLNYTIEFDIYNR